MKDSFILKILDIFKYLYTKAGVNYSLMRLIVKHKLIMDGRRGQRNISSNEEGKDKNNFYISLIIYAIVGLASAPIITLDINPIVKMSLYFSFFMVMILSVFVSDFSSVILDINDKDILETKGVDVKTLNAAKFTHIFIYMTLLSLSISIAAILCSIRYGIKFILLFILNIFLINVFMIIVTAIMYFVILKLFSGERLKDALNAFQALFILVFILGYQVVARAFTFVDLQFVYEPKFWNLLLPPMWFGSSFNLLYNIDVNNLIIIMSGLAIVVPIVSIFVYVKLIPRFEYNLQKLNDNTYVNKKFKEKLSIKVSKLICKDKEERAFFNFVYDVLKKDREFKTKVYPSLVMGAFMPFLMMISSFRSDNNFLTELRSEPSYLLMYFFVLMSQSILTTLKFSKEYEASWIYDILPINNKKNIYTAAFKASIYLLVLPLFILMSIGFIIILSPKVIVDLAIGFVATVLSSMITFKLNEKHMPFTCEYQNTNTASNIGTMIKSMVFVGVIALGHFLLSSSIFLKITYLIGLVILVRLIWNKVFEV
ncbi:MULTISPECIES: hypothetical protein [Romboutsia]|uniref:hypothetical protein n=1 Tax=Romboutsia TaxID=1501226 RepID=UPI00189F7E59|nr:MULTISPECIES: hypothetical protein [Romboutsia]MCH1960506.1 hypothetical protein [Romboutsia hominis]MCH1969062.1 hypothetical protein [Romboutsia hominis]MDB8791137.1 hypothetical protein [Romboutsia sp. 1001216sp1]MDB8802520.1 hypothetical protein [Romboutsia sp. 1001216sp1]MDB8813917.1 hypothetical protein [Romboutsia sp. 1001216sp1]